MTMTYRDGGTSRTITAVSYRDGGTTRTITEVYIGDGGTNRLVFAAVNLLGLDPVDTQTAPTDASATYSLTSAGLETATGSSNNTWLLAGSAADYEARLTVNSGSLTSGTVGSWLNLGTTRAWNLTNTSNVSSTLNASTTVEIRLASTGTVVASVTVAFQARVL